jgi:hypothetical protein
VTKNIAGISLPSLLIVPGAWHEPDQYVAHTLVNN